MLPKPTFRSRVSVLLVLASIVTSSAQAQPVPGDFDDDRDVDIFDHATFVDCQTGPGGGTITSNCQPGDFDSDQDIDLLDWGTLQVKFGAGQSPRIDRFEPTPGEWIVDDIGLSQVVIGFDRSVVGPGDAATAWSVNGGSVTPASTSYDDATHALTMTFTPPIENDRVTIIIDYSITDADGNELDGEIADPNHATLPSGDSVRGGQAVFRINVLQGDANRDGFVDAADEALIQAALETCTGDPAFDPNADLNADGCVNQQDLDVFTPAQGNALPALDGTPPRIQDRAPDIDERFRDHDLNTVVATFTEDVSTMGLSPSSLFVIKPGGFVQSADSLSVVGRTATFTFDSPPPPNQLYRFNLTNAFADTSGGLLSPDAVTKWQASIDDTPTTIIQTSPTSAESMVALTRETIITFRDSIQPKQSLTTNDIRAEFAGQTLPITANSPSITGNGKRLKIFYDPPLPPSARVRVTVVGDNILDDLGNLVDADGDGQPGGTRTFDFDTCSISRIPNTGVEGYIIAAERAPGCTDPKDPACDIPLEGVTIWAGGFPQDGPCDGDPPEEFCAVTDIDGHFIMQNTPVPEFYVEIDGTSVTAVGGQLPPADCSYPRGEMQLFHSVAGHTIQLQTSGVPYNIHIPCIASDSVVPVVAGQPTDVGLSPTGQQVFADMFPDADPSALSINIPAGSLTTDDGTPGTRVSVYPVDVDRLPVPLMNGLAPPLMMEIVTDGAVNLDLPAPVCFPNVPDPTTGEPLPPGAKSALLSFNHDTGQWESGGPMTVSDDGQSVCSDEGTGFTEFCYHAQAPASDQPPPCVGACCTSSPPTDAQELPQDGSGCQGCGRKARDCLKQCYYQWVTWTGICVVGSSPFLELPFVPCEILNTINGIGCEFLCLGDYAICTSSSGVSASEHRGPGCGVALAVDPTAQQISEIARQIGEILYPFVLSGVDTLPPDVAANVNELWELANALAGGDALRFMLSERVRLEEELAMIEATCGPASIPNLRNSVRYAAVVGQTDGRFVLRGETDSFGQYSLFLPRDGELQFVSFYDSSTNEWGIVFPKLSPDTLNGLPRLVLVPIDGAAARDFDFDGLPDVAEFVLGTNPNNADTDVDGVSDGAEVRAGTDPLDRLPAVTGIIASADTPGTAVDVCAINDIAIVADSAKGVTVFDVTAGQAPVAVAQVDTPGTAMAVGCSGDLIAVADGSQGLTIIDATDPPAAFIARQVFPAFLGGGTAQAVATLGDLAFVGTKRIGNDGGRVAVVELKTGIVLQRFDMGGTVEDLAIEGSTLYAYANGELHVMPFVRGLVLETAGSVAVPGTINGVVGRGRLFVGGQIAYVVHTFGYHTFDVSDPEAPALLGLGNTPQLWKQMAVTPASGTVGGQMLGVAAVGLDSTGCHLDRDQVYLYDVSDPTNNNQFVTLFDTPGCAWTVSLFNGQAYVADRSRGLEVINYLAFDTGSEPPTVPVGTMGFAALIDGASMTGGEVDEGKRIVLQSHVLDDVQVRNVEFFANGQRIVADGSFPFETAYRIPLDMVGQTINFTAIARDTGGNELSLGPLPFTILADNKPPIVIIDAPFEGEVFFVYDIMHSEVAAVDNVEVADIIFEIDGSQVQAQRNSLQTWDVEVPRTRGPHTLTVTATDTANLSSSASVGFVVKDRVISREFAVFHDVPNPLEIGNVLSREFTVMRRSHVPLNITSVFSREFTVAAQSAP